LEGAPTRQLILRNGFTSGLRAPQFLQLEQHGQHAFEFSVEMNLVTGEAFEAVRIDGFAVCLGTD
jgi:hypothetical protein